MSFFDFQEFLFEEEAVAKPVPKTKHMLLGKMADGKKVMCSMKVGHTIKMSAEEFVRLQNMRVSMNNKKMMLGHKRGGKEYLIAKKAANKFTIFHYNKTLHEFTAVGVFQLPQKPVIVR